MICFQDLPRSGFCVLVLRVRGKEGCNMVTKVHVLPLSKAFPLYLENVLCHIQLKCLEKRENLETLGMYVGGGALDQIS